MSSWVMTVLVAFGKALLISLSILIGSCCLRFLYRLWSRRMGCSDGNQDDLSESCKYEMELQSVQDLNHVTASAAPAAASADAVSEIELPPSPGANTSCPPYSTFSLYPDKPRTDDYSYSDNVSCSTWSRYHAYSDGGEETGTDAELTSMVGETTTVCSVLTGNDEQRSMAEADNQSPAAQRASLHTPSPHRERRASPQPLLQSPGRSARRAPPPPPPPLLLAPAPPSPLPPLPASGTPSSSSLHGPFSPPPLSPPTDSGSPPPLTEFQDYQCYVEPPLVKFQTPPVLLPKPVLNNQQQLQQQQQQEQQLQQQQEQQTQPTRDRGTELFLSQYYKALEREQES